MSERSHRHNPAAHSRSRPTCAKRGGPSLTHRPHPTANPTILFASVPRQRWVPNHGKQTGREWSFFIEKAHSARRFSPQGVLLAQTKDAKIVCVIGCQITRIRATHNLKRLASARHDREKTVLLPECTLQTKQSVKTKKRMMYSPGGTYIVVAPVVTSWAVTGQQVVFLHMYLQTRVTLRAFPVATPRGRSSKFPWRGTFIKSIKSFVFPYSFFTRIKLI